MALNLARMIPRIFQIHIFMCLLGGNLFAELQRVDGPKGGTYSLGTYTYSLLSDETETEVSLYKQAAKDYLWQYYQVAPESYDLTVMRMMKDPAGHHIVYQMALNEIPIINTALALHIKEGEVLLINGVILPFIQDLINEHEHFDHKVDPLSVEKAKQQFQSLYKSSDETQPQLVYYYKEDSETPLQLCYQFEFTPAAFPKTSFFQLTEGEDMKPIHGPVRVLMSAYSGDVVAEDSLAIHMGLQEKLGIEKKSDVTFVTGKAKVYKQNWIKTPDVSMVDLPNLLGNGILYGKYLRVYSAGAHKGLKVEDDKHAFVYSLSDPRFDNVSAYYYGDLTLSWFDSMNIPLGGIILTYHIHDQETPGVPMNNAYYDPLDTSIHIGDGDGQILQNLSRDIDVIAHETSHHIIYNYGGLHSLKGESGAIHEGTADYFTYALTGDPYLAEGAPVMGDYLRTAENQLTYPMNFEYDIHTRGNLWSSTLWQLRNSVVTEEQKNIDIIVARGLAFLNPEAVFLDYANGLLLADQEYMDGRYRCKIASVLGGRGFHFTTERVGLSTCASLTKSRISANQGNYQNVLREQQIIWDKEEETIEDDPEYEERGILKYTPLGCNIAWGSSLQANSPLILWLLIIQGAALWFGIRRR